MAVGFSWYQLALIGLAGLLSASCSGSASPSAETAGQSHSPVPSASASPSASSASPSPSLSASGQAKAALSYSKYANPRFGFTTLWPSSFSVQAPPVDGDGQAWASPDGRVMLSAYGANNIFSYSPSQDEAADSRGMSVVYSNISGSIVTVSGYTNGGRTIVYQRDVVGPGSVDTLYWSYPASEKAQWDAAVTTTARAFQPGDVSTGH